MSSSCRHPARASDDDGSILSPTAADWARGLSVFDASLRARGLRERTRQAYGGDLGQLAEWASGHELGPTDLGHRELRRFAGVISERGASKATVARRLAAVRAFYRHLLERGEIEANPAQLVSSPRREAYLPRVLKPGEVGDLLERIPA